MDDGVVNVVIHLYQPLPIGIIVVLEPEETTPFVKSKTAARLIPPPANLNVSYSPAFA